LAASARASEPTSVSANRRLRRTSSARNRIRPIELATSRTCNVNERRRASRTLALRPSAAGPADAATEISDSISM